jgi:hypothetical protein
MLPPSFPLSLPPGSVGPCSLPLSLYLSLSLSLTCEQGARTLFTGQREREREREREGEREDRCFGTF